MATERLGAAYGPRTSKVQDDSGHLQTTKSTGGLLAKQFPPITDEEDDYEPDYEAIQEARYERNRPDWA